MLGSGASQVSGLCEHIYMSLLVRMEEDEYIVYPGSRLANHRSDALLESLPRALWSPLM